MTLPHGAVALLACASLLGCVGLGACSFGGPPPLGQARADAQTVAACRQRAEQVYEIQNRPDIYRQPPAINTPSSGTYAPGGSSDRQLSDLYARDRMVSDCVRNTGTETDRGQEQGLRNQP